MRFGSKSGRIRRFPRRAARGALVALAALSAAAGPLDAALSLGPEWAVPGAWYEFHDPGSVISPSSPARAEGPFGPSFRVQAALGKSVQYPYAGFGAGFGQRDLSRYAGLRFWARGRGSWAVIVATAATAAAHNDYRASFDLGPGWTRVEVPFSSFQQTWGPASAWDPAEARSVAWCTAGGPGDREGLEVAGLECYAPGEAAPVASVPADPILPGPKLDQDGFRARDPKEFFLAEVPDGPGPGDAFVVEDPAGRVAWSGTLDRGTVDDRPSTGETVLRGDFSGLRAPGRYRVRVGGLASPAFTIGPHVYARLFDESLHCFRVLRCGVAVDDPDTGVRHPACHLGDASLPLGNGRVDLSGGWHNAGDYGKWTVEESISCAWMLWLAELKGPLLGPRRARLLDEARWGLVWLLKMQRPDGSVLHKVDAQDHFCDGQAPQDDPYASRRLPGPATSVDAGDFVGVMALAARAYARDDPAFARRCLAAARRSWGWLWDHPDVTGDDRDYHDLDPSQETLWALGEMARLEPSLRGRFVNRLDSAPLAAVTWPDPRFFGLMAQWEDPGLGPDERADLSEALDALCSDLESRSQANGYGVVTSAAEYYWESNETLLGRANALFCGGLWLGRPDYTRAGLRQLNWLLGANSLDFSFVAGHGERSLSHPWHWTHASLGLLLKGWSTGGPNQYPKGADEVLKRVIARGTPPAKCYVDANQVHGVTGSWASNEGETSLNAALVFASGWNL